MSNYITLEDYYTTNVAPTWEMGEDITLLTNASFNAMSVGTLTITNQIIQPVEPRKPLLDHMAFALGLGGLFAIIFYVWLVGVVGEGLLYGEYLSKWILANTANDRERAIIAYTLSALFCLPILVVVVFRVAAQAIWLWASTLFKVFCRVIFKSMTVKAKTDEKMEETLREAWEICKSKTK